MRRTVLLGVVWLVAGALSVALAVAAVGLVGNEVTGSRPSPLSAEEVAQELASTSSTTTVPGVTSSETTAPSAPPDVTASTVTTSSAGSPTTAAPPPPTTAAVGETRTYALVGGTATLRFEPSGVTVLAATPNPGFSVHAEPEHVNGVKVEFESAGHESRVAGWWDGGPRDDVREDVED
ncbi:MAG: hypothetical protein ACLGI8_11655 [Acidimicrobiia bacterium]